MMDTLDEEHITHMNTCYYAVTMLCYYYMNTWGLLCVQELATPERLIKGFAPELFGKPVSMGRARTRMCVCVRACAHRVRLCACATWHGCVRAMFHTRTCTHICAHME